MFSTIEFHHQSQNVEPAEWTALITLCLAPLAVHLIAGVPRIIHLHESTPRWHSTVILYNPITIIWRYCAITERCLCTPSLRNRLQEIAAVNVVYWDKSWVGSEDAVQRGMKLCVQPSPPARDRLFSTAALKTVIVAIQGIGALGAILPGKLSGVSGESLPTVFAPLACIGLLRLPAAYWLTDEHHLLQLFERTERQDSWLGAGTVSNPFIPLLDSTKSQSSVQVSDQSSRDMPFAPYRPGLVALAVRLFYALFILLFTGISIWGWIDRLRLDGPIPLTWFFINWCYIFFTISCAGVLIPRLVNREVLSISIPCANKTWYVVLTGVLIILAVVSVTIAALETYRNIIGKYTAYIDLPGIWNCEYTMGDGEVLKHGYEEIVKHGLKYHMGAWEWFEEE